MSTRCLAIPPATKASHTRRLREYCSADAPRLVDTPGYAPPTCAPSRPPLFSSPPTRDANMHAGWCSTSVRGRRTTLTSRAQHVTLLVRGWARVPWGMWHAQNHSIGLQRRISAGWDTARRDMYAPALRCCRTAAVHIPCPRTTRLRR